MTDTHEARVEAAAKAAHRFDSEVSEMFGKPFDPDMGSLPQWAYNTHLDKARAALAAADAVVAVEQIAGVLNNAGAQCGWCSREPGEPLSECGSCYEVLNRYARAVHALLTGEGKHD